MASVIITGGGGFLGQCLASALLKEGQIQTESSGKVALEKLILADIFFPPNKSDLQPRIASSKIVVLKQGDVSDRAYCDDLLQEASASQHVSIFHLGGVMSADGERDFDLAMRVNLYGTMNMLEAARSSSSGNNKECPKFIFASAGATMGSGSPTDYIQKEDTISDATRATPHTTYGMTKACSELLVSDYARRNFVNGRALRLPTIVVRAGKPNAATTGCYSGVVREPLSGIDIALPIAQDVPHAVTGARAAVQAMITLHNAPQSQIESVLGFDRTIFLPAIALSLGDLQEALFKVVSPDSHGKLGKITYQVDEKLSAVVGSFPTKVDAQRAQQLGIPPAPSAETLVREYMEDFASALVPGIVAAPNATATANATTSSKVAVITGGGSGIGRAVATRLAKGGWSVVLVGRRMETLKETQSLLPNDNTDSSSLCVRADVSQERDVAQLFEKVQQHYGKVDLLFNNAGTNSKAATLEQVSYQDFERVLKTNVGGPFLCARAAMKLMMANGAGGRIINNGSISAHTPRPGSACYTSSKHALLGLTKCIALDGRAHNIACGQIDFGNVVSDISLATNKPGAGALQANGTLLEEPFMAMSDAAEAVWSMANLPLEANVLQMTLMATTMPFVGRG